MPSRNRATAEAILGDTFEGVLVSDCLSIYDGIEGEQQKCYAHHLKALSTALKSEAARGSAYLLELRALLHTAMLLKQLQDRYSELLAGRVSKSRGFDTLQEYVLFGVL